ncbi:2-oxoacid:ferredoxin oxidoreductase subunit beta [bacterium]|nr:2-oxoacid:ferredoxin oxidoreductase subunit beta [bacterium]
MTDVTTQVEKKTFRNHVKPIWCPGCGDHSVLACLVKALDSLELNITDTAVISGIGCSSRLPGYMSCYGMNSIHGRAIPIATGLKMGRPEMTVVITGGDGDGFAIGGNHVMHAVRRNIDLTYIMMDNGIYGLTKGQVSPTTPIGYKTKTTAYGAYEKPIAPLEVMLAYGCTYVAQAFSADMPRLQELIVEAIKYPGFSFINVISPCVTYRGGSQIYKDLKPLLKPIGAEHDIHDWDAAHKIARDKTRLHVGVLYQERRETYQETQDDLKQRAPHAEAPSVVDIAKKYR